MIELSSTLFIYQTINLIASWAKGQGARRNKIMAVENVQEIVDYIKANESNEDVKKFVQGLNPINLDSVKTFVGTDKDAKSWFDKEKDLHSNKVTDTFKKNDLPKLLSDKIKELYPEADPRDLRIKELEDKYNQKEAAEKRQIRMNKGIMHADSKKLPKELVEYLLGDSEESTIANIDKIESVFNPYITSQVEARLKSGYKPSTEAGSTAMTKEEFQKLTYTERVKLSKDNPDQYKELTK